MIQSRFSKKSYHTSFLFPKRKKGRNISRQHWLSPLTLPLAVRGEGHGRAAESVENHAAFIQRQMRQSYTQVSWNIFQSVNGIIPFSVKTYKAKLGYKMDLLQSVIGVIISVKINKAKLGYKYGSPAISHPLFCQVPQDQWGSHIMELAPHQETLNSPCHGLLSRKRGPLH